MFKFICLLFLSLTMISSPTASFAKSKKDEASKNLKVEKANTAKDKDADLEKFNYKGGGLEEVEKLEQEHDNKSGAENQESADEDTKEKD